MEPAPGLSPASATEEDALTTAEMYVQSRYDLMIPGPNYNTVTGTYQVGLNNTLNNEPQPITYRVTGTVTNAK